MSIKKARKTLQNKEKFNYDILDKVANSGGEVEGNYGFTTIEERTILQESFAGMLIK